MDTANDYRIRLAEEAVERLEKMIIQKRIPYRFDKNKAMSIIHSLKKNIMTIKYSFLPLSQLLESESLDTIKMQAIELEKILVDSSFLPQSTKQKHIIAEIKYCLRILSGIKERLKLGEENKPEFAIDIIGARVVSVSEHPKSSKLKICKVGDKANLYQIITNKTDVKKDDVYAIAFLPPVMLLDIVSEGMICSDKLDESKIGARISNIHSSEIQSIIIKLTSNKR
ncbi:MAG: tRNA-binding protein [Candidatus Asgardarchaeia archaeon]